MNAELDEIRRFIAEGRALFDRLERSLSPPEDAVGETFDQWVDRWVAERKVCYPAEEKRTYELWIQPELGQKEIAKISRADIENWVESMDRHVADGKLAASTARRIWSVLRVMFRDASRSKVRALRVREDNPADRVSPPDASSARASTFLYPSEFLRLVGCEEVPLVFRRLYAVTVYLFPRAGEMRSIRWSDIDLATGRVHIHTSVNRKGSEGRTKTDADRQFVAEATLVPLLRAMHEQALEETRLFPWIPQQNNLARALRQHLEMAGVKRADIFADDESRRPLTFHDLRATGITWQAMRGDSPTTIMERVGHANLSTTEGYIRRGRLMVSENETVFPPLPDSLLKKSTG